MTIENTIEITVIYKIRVLRGKVGCRDDERRWETTPGLMRATFEAPIDYRPTGFKAKTELTERDMRLIGFRFWQHKDHVVRHVVRGGLLPQRDMERYEIVAIFCGPYSAAAISFEEPFTFHPIHHPSAA
jgi:hypothetical protein